MVTTTPQPGPVRVDEGYGLGDAPADGSVLAWPTVVEWLEQSRNYWVCSTRPDGRPHAMPVWGLWIDGALWWSTDPASVKARNLARRPDVVIHLESGDEVCVLEGSTRRIDAAELPASFVDDYDAKYGHRLDLDVASPNFGFYVLAPTVALTWREVDYPTSATRWTF
ncbi:MAG: pyridoxamine 5'-phosphate oxidase family protein [Acidimicrobiia bacterium]